MMHTDTSFVSGSSNPGDIAPMTFSIQTPIAWPSYRDVGSIAFELSKEFKGIPYCECNIQICRITNL